MNFVNTQYLPHIAGTLLFLSVLFFILNAKFYKWVKSYWFYERSLTSRISAFFYMLGLSLMLISLLDLRGPEEKIKSSIPDQKTIIVLDSSASMLAEDVRPSRFVKALQLARHFVKRAAGHQVALVLFSDIQKRIVPFTDDIDLLDSRLAALEKTNSVSGGSNISQAISEAVQYFESEDKASVASGNILVFTDAEENEGGMDVELDKNINLAVVGIGTAKGANIPLRWDDGSFRGYKTFKGEAVTTKLDEDFIKKLGKSARSYRYWIANSYSLPTDDVLSFFRGSFSKNTGKGDVRIRPVYSHLILIPAIIIYCLGVFWGRFKSFHTVVVAFFMFGLVGTQAKGQDDRPRELSPALRKDLDRMKSGKADRKEVLKVAEKLLRENESQQAAELYAEYARPVDEEQVLFNRATALLKTGKLEESIPLVQKIMHESSDAQLKDRMRNNLLLSLEHREKNKEEQKSQDQKKEDKDPSDKSKGDEKKDPGQSGKDSDSSKKKDDKEGKQDNKDKQKEGSPSDDKKENDEDKKQGQQKDPKDLEAPQRESRPQSVEEKEKMIEQKRKMVKTPAMVKQIMNDDRELQKKMMDTSTKERGEKTKRDW